MMENKEFSEAAFKAKIRDKMDEVIAAEAEWFKKIEELGAIQGEFPENPTEDEKQVMAQLAANINGGVIYSLRQALIRYGNLLFM